MNDLTVAEFIEVLKTFPQSWEVTIGDGTGEECYPIKGVFESSETDYETPSYSYAYVQIEPFNPYRLDLDDIISECSLKMYGDRNWYNTREVYTKRFKNGEIQFHLTTDGGIEIIKCRDPYWNTMNVEELEEYNTCYDFNRHDYDDLKSAIEIVKEKYYDNQDIQKAINEILELSL